MYHLAVLLLLALVASPLIQAQNACFQSKIGCIPSISSASACQSLANVQSCLDGASCETDAASEAVVAYRHLELISSCQDPVCLTKLRACFPKSQSYFSNFATFDITSQGDAVCSDLIQSGSCITAAQGQCKDVNMQPLISALTSLSQHLIFVPTFCAKSEQGSCVLKVLKCLPPSFIGFVPTDLSASCPSKSAVTSCIQSSLGQCKNSVEKDYANTLLTAYTDSCKDYCIETTLKCFASVPKETADPLGVICSDSSMQPCVANAKTLASPGAEEETKITEIQEVLSGSCTSCSIPKLIGCVETFCSAHSDICRIDGQRVVSGNNPNGRPDPQTCLDAGVAISCLNRTLPGCEWQQVYEAFRELDISVSHGPLHHCRLAGDLTSLTLGWNQLVKRVIVYLHGVTKQISERQSGWMWQDVLKKYNAAEKDWISESGKWAQYVRQYMGGNDLSWPGLGGNDQGGNGGNWMNDLSQQAQNMANNAKNRLGSWMG